jgi:hypothetical protein
MHALVQRARLTSPLHGGTLVCRQLTRSLDASIEI